MLSSEATGHPYLLRFTWHKKNKKLYRPQTEFLSCSNNPEGMFQVLTDLQSMQSDYTYIPRTHTMWALSSQHQLFHFDPLLFYWTNTEVISKITLCPSLFPWVPDSSFRLLSTTPPHLCSNLRIIQFFFLNSNSGTSHYMATQTFVPRYFLVYWFPFSFLDPEALCTYYRSF